MEKTKKFLRVRNGELERSGKRSCRIQSPEYQELSVDAVTVPLITLKSSETQNVDLTDKVRANHYLRHFECRSALHGNQLFWDVLQSPVRTYVFLRHECRGLESAPNITWSSKDRRHFLRRSPSRNARLSHENVVLQLAVDRTSRHDGFLNFWKGSWRSLGHNSAILVRHEITSLTLYHICKVLYPRTFPKWCSPFYGTTGDGLFLKNMEKSKRCVFVGVSNRKLCCGRVLELQRSFQKFSFVPVH